MTHLLLQLTFLLDFFLFLNMYPTGESCVATDKVSAVIDDPSVAVDDLSVGFILQ